MREKLIYTYDIKFINSFLFILTTRRALFTLDIDKSIGSVVLTCYVFLVECKHATSRNLCEKEERASLKLPLRF